MMLKLNIVVMLTAFCVACSRPPETVRHESIQRSLGKGVLSSYGIVSADQKPIAIGLSFTADALTSLPADPSDLNRCYDANADGKIDGTKECSMWHERVIPLPSEVARREDIPIKWILANWNPHGHIPPGVYDVPHFDVHFYLEPMENVFALQRGPCGPEFVRCDQFEAARKPLPSNYLHPDFKDVQAVAPAMGNHWIDLTGPEFNGKKFTRSWIYGSYDGRITFLEEMLTLEYILSKPNKCEPIKQPDAVATSGYYPTESCVRFDSGRGQYSVSIEKFERRAANPPEAVAATSQ
jgi:hypothetical protein